MLPRTSYLKQLMLVNTQIDTRAEYLGVKPVGIDVFKDYVRFRSPPPTSDLQQWYVVNGGTVVSVEHSTRDDCPNLLWRLIVCVYNVVPTSTIPTDVKFDDRFA
jgi:hypothetical protein